MGETIHDILKRYWGYESFRPLQEDIIHSVLEGKDTLGLMPTGGGKSITFQVPAMKMDGICLVITPLIALMKDQVDNLKQIGIKAAYIHSGLSRREMIVALENCIFGKYKFLYVSPERVDTDLFLAKLNAMQVNMVVVDEAHCISQWGYDFRPSYLRIATIREKLPQIPILALTATATPEVADDIQDKLGFARKNLFRKSFYRPNLAYIVRNSENKMDQLLHILNRVPGTAIVYVRSRQQTKEIAQELRRQGINADFYHAGLITEDKNEKQQQWKSGNCRVIVSTNAFGMGIDKPDVRLVVHYDLPGSPEEYYQEAGRAGRDGNKAYAVILNARSDKTKLKKRISDTFPERDFIKRTYDALCNFLQIAEGSGLNSVFDFDLNKFCRNFKLPVLPTFSALKILEQAGYIIFTEEVDALSRVMFTVQRDELYRLKMGDEKCDELIQCLLRSYTGLFADYVLVQEDLLMLRTGLSHQEIYDYLVYLTKQHIIHYIPRKKTPFIVFTSAREDIRYVTLSREVYEVRKERFEKRILSMIDYSTQNEQCRSNFLLHYFGEFSEQNCCTCDVCLYKGNNELTTSDFNRIENCIRNIMGNKSVPLNYIVESLPFPQEKVIEVIRYLCDEEYMANKEGEYSIIKK